MIDVRNAVVASQEYIKSIADLMPGGNLRLEETEYDDQANRWLITVSYVPYVPDDPMTILSMSKAERVYKRLVVNADDGKVLAMKNR